MDKQTISEVMRGFGKMGAGKKKTMSEAAKEQRRKAAIASAKARAKKKSID